MAVARIYVRVSTDLQTNANQRLECGELHARLAPKLKCYEFDESESAVKARPMWEQVKRESRAGDLVIVWALDRIGRSMQGVINDVLMLDARGVRLVSVREEWLDTRGPVRDLLLAIFAWVAQQERTRLIERTRAGLDRARREGKRLGRPPTSPVLLNVAKERVQEGWAVARAAKVAGVNERSLRRFLKAQKPAAKSPSKSAG